MMKNVLRLALRRLRCGWRIHLAAILLTALTGTAFLVYQSYLEQMGARLSRQTKELELVCDMQVELPEESPMLAPAEPTGAWKSRPSPLLVGAGRSFVAGSTYGRLRAFTLRPSKNYLVPSPSFGEALLPQHEMDRLSLQVGQTVKLLLPGGVQSAVTLSGTYNASPAYAELLLNHDWFVQLTGQMGFNRFMYDLIPGLSMQNAETYLDRVYPDAATIVTRQMPATLARQAVGETYSGSGNLIALVFLFLALGVFTALLLSFMDNKRELAVLKSLGLSPRELSGLFLSSGIVTAFSGALMALGLTLLVVHFLSERGITLPVAFSDAPSMLLWTALSYAAAIGVPAALSRRATVNQLLYDQPIPIVSTQVKALRQRNLYYEDRIRMGWQVVRLPVDDGVLLGFLFKKVGDVVKQGEVLASAPGWWGLTYTEYVAAVDGEVHSWSEETGYLSIKPCMLRREEQPDAKVDALLHTRLRASGTLASSHSQGPS